MKILFLSSYAHLVLDKASTKTSGGAELQVALLARELASLGHEIVVAGGDIGQTDKMVFDGVTTRNAGKFHTGRLPEMLGAIPRVLSVLREERPDWVVVMGWTAWLFVLWAVRPFLGFQLDFVCALDSEVNGVYRKENPIFGTLFEFAMRRCDARHAITADQKACMEASGMSCVFYRSLVFQRTGPLDGHKPVDFLWVSRCQPIKRPKLFIELANALPDASFEMVCSPENRPLWEEVRSLAAGCPNLVFFDNVPYHHIQDHFDRAKVFVNTSEWEGLPNTFIHSGLGRTAILSLAVNPDGLFERHAPGVFAAGNFPSLIEAAQKMLAAPEWLSSLQGGSVRFVETTYNNARETGTFLSGLEQKYPPTGRSSAR